MTAKDTNLSTNVESSENLDALKPDIAVTAVAEMEQSRLSKKKWFGRCLIVAGLVGLVIATCSMPRNNDLIGPSAFWSGVTLVSLIVTFAGIPGAYGGYVRPIHLKIIDLVWVLASAVAIFIAVVQTSQVFPESARGSYAKQMERARANGHTMAIQAYREQCTTAATLSDEQCEDLRFIANMLIDYSDQPWLPRNKVTELCPIPWTFDNPPRGYGRNLTGACINAITIVTMAEDPVMTDKANVEKWRFAFFFWPQLMMGLVALRIMKSISEVFWLKAE